MEAVTSAIEVNDESGPAWLLHARILAAGEGNSKEAIGSIRRATALGEYGVIMEAEVLENEGRLDMRSCSLGGAYRDCPRRCPSQGET